MCAGTPYQHLMAPVVNPHRAAAKKEAAEKK